MLAGLLLNPFSPIVALLQLPGAGNEEEAFGKERRKTSALMEQIRRDDMEILKIVTMLVKGRIL